MDITYNPYNYMVMHLNIRTALTHIQYVYGLLPEPTHHSRAESEPRLAMDDTLSCL